MLSEVYFWNLENFGSRFCDFWFFVSGPGSNDKRNVRKSRKNVKKSISNIPINIPNIEAKVIPIAKQQNLEQNSIDKKNYSFTKTFTRTRC